jgi:hypothetical protein
VRTHDRVRVWLHAPGGTANPIVGDVDSLGPETLAVDGSRIPNGRIMAVQVGDRRYRHQTRIGACVFGTGNSIIAGSIDEDDFGSFIVQVFLTMIASSLARSCLFPPDYWIEGRLPGRPPFDVVGPLGRDPRPATRWGAVCEDYLMPVLPVVALAIGVRQEAGDATLALTLLGANALSGWLQEKACPKVEPGDLWLDIDD